MTKESKNILYLIVLTLIPCLGIFLLLSQVVSDNRDNLVSGEVPIDITDPKNTSGEIGINPTDPKKDEKVLTAKENYQRMLDSGKFFSLTPPRQPLLQGDYKQNTYQMIEYMKKNALKIQLNSPITEGYIYFKIKSTSKVDQKAVGKLFIYIYNGKISGYIDSKTAVYSHYDEKEKVWELIFDVKNIGILPWQEKSTKNIDITNYISYYGATDYISTFWVSQYSSTIEKIYFVYDSIK